jgi:hypothetical protein
MKNQSNDRKSPPRRWVPTLKEIMDNTIANMAIEGFELTPAEITRVKERARRELAGWKELAAALKKERGSK